MNLHSLEVVQERGKQVLQQTQPGIKLHAPCTVSHTVGASNRYSFPSYVKLLAIQLSTVVLSIEG